ncbi:alpha-2-macroglobulin family protein [Pedobacter ginsengisoli]|uniref:alpha-2-macroglobulin family protein n=1 Tax=Pedobacter ginsengisoli TaxID=363852 RepID=UPI00254E417D|nr:alpha-2-macroglobulin family protein [Pedobacter ginsengisoli]
MKRLLLSLYLFIAGSVVLYAQRKLTTSPISSHYTYIYKLNDKEAADFALGSVHKLQDKVLHTLVDSFSVDQPAYFKQLPYGNYLYLSVSRNRLKYKIRNVRNVQVKFISDGDRFQFILTDLQGRLIENADVTQGAHYTIKFDPQSKSYHGKPDSKDKLISIRYGDVSSFYKYAFDRPQQPKKKKKPSAPAESEPYTGQLHFNKPRYRPLDTVRFKVYLVTKNGKSIHNKTLKLELKNSGRDIPIASLNPYREGGYEGSFVLADSMKLKLNESYVLHFKENVKGKLKTVFSGFFYYGDYELKSASFFVRTNKTVHHPGSPVIFYMKATDENGLATPDGRVEVDIKTSGVRKFYNPKEFVRTELWKTSLRLDPVGETVLRLPDSIFPKVNMNFTVNFSFRNSNNESRQASQNLSYEYENKKITTLLEKDSLKFTFEVNDSPAAHEGILYTIGEDGRYTDSIVTGLPQKIKLDPRVIDYAFRTAEGISYPTDYKWLQPQFQASAERRQDSLLIHAGSAQQIPFWYTIFSGGKVLKRGYSTQLDTVLQKKAGEDEKIHLSYLWQGRVQSQQNHVYTSPESLQIAFEAPEAVYPGQIAQMKVLVTDKAKRPVAGTDLTAYAYTAKFGDIPYYRDLFEKPFIYKAGKPLPYSPEPFDQTQSLKLDWLRWHQKFGLDTVPYFQFIYPDELYAGREKIESNQTIVVPFLIREHAIDPAILVYIDGIPVYYSGAKQLKRYAFNISPGTHKVEVYSREYKASVTRNFEQGFKTILGIAADPANSKASVSLLEDKEFEQRLRGLNGYMIYVNENFEGNKAVIYSGSEEFLINPPPNTIPRKLLYIGPFKEKSLRFKSGDLDIPFTRDSNKVFTFLHSGITLRALDTADKYHPVVNLGIEGVSYSQNPVLKHEIDSIWTDYLDFKSRNTHFLAENPKPKTVHTGSLRMVTDTSLTNRLPYIKNIVLYKKDDPAFMHVNGGYINDLVLDEAWYRIFVLLKNNSYFTEDIRIRAGGINYILLKNKQVHPADEMSKALDHKIKFSGMTSPGIRNYNYKLPGKVVSPLTGKAPRGKMVISGTIIDEYTGEPLPGAGLFFGRPLKGLGQTNGNGYFSFIVPKKTVLTVTYVGYETKTITIGRKSDWLITLKERTDLEDVVIRGYSGSGRRNFEDVPVANVEQLLQGKVAGLNIQNNSGGPGLRGSVNIRGLSTITSTGSGSEEGKNALLIVDGKPFNGTMEQISNSAIVSIEMLDPVRGAAIYGKLGANGVTVITTNGSQYFGAEGGQEPSGRQSLRSNFSDYAFWQPKLLTGQDGKARFKVKFPDDMTNWSTTVYAMNGHKQYGYLNTSIRSFKSLSANITSPSFALSGDSLKVIGKLMNYSDKEETVTRKFEYNGSEIRNNNLTFKNAHIDTIAVLATGSAKAKDSLQFLYTLHQDKGYFDGEKRGIPLLPLGIQETKGYFSALHGDTTTSYNFDAAPGQVTLHAEASVFPVLLSEMDKLRNYEYLCNEQLASKLKGLILEQKLRKYLNEDFKEEKNIKELIKKLQNNRGPHGGWGWWQNTEDEMWISGHVVEALLLAKEAGYAVELDTRVLYNYLNDQLTGRKNTDQLFMVKLMRTLENKYDFRSWFEAVEKQKADQKDQTLFSRLQLMQLKQQAGMPADINWLLKQKKSTMFGNSYWGEPGIAFWDNSIQNTLLAYHILKAKGGYNDELNLIIQYFLGQRKDGQWRNTYESSLILETILPELMVEGKKQEAPSITLNKTEVVNAFPFTKTIHPGKITVDKKGTAPVYFTAYQQFNNPKPEKVSKDFEVKTSFEQNGKPITQLKGGASVFLKAEVEVRADADYVMIEIPIPAGCSYENKPQSYWGVETHREYFKHKTSIFCTKLKQGKYTFSIQLMPRYSGNYNLNPAKAEMMYFPVFYGREGMKKVNIN